MLRKKKGYLLKLDGEKAVETALELLKENEFQLKPEPTAPQRWKRPEGYKEEK